MFQFVGWFVPTFCSSKFGCQCMGKIMHPFLWYWYFRQTLCLLRKNCQ